MHAFALPPCLGEGQHEVERTTGSVGFALIEIALDAAELIGHMGEADDRLPPQSPPVEQQAPYRVALSRSGYPSFLRVHT